MAKIKETPDESLLAEIKQTYAKTYPNVIMRLVGKNKELQAVRTAVCKDLVKKAEEALPSLVEICKALAGSLGMEEVGVGKFCIFTIVYNKIWDHDIERVNFVTFRSNQRGVCSYQKS